MPTGFPGQQKPLGIYLDALKPARAEYKREKKLAEKAYRMARLTAWNIRKNHLLRAKASFLDIVVPAKREYLSSLKCHIKPED